MNFEYFIAKRIAKKNKESLSNVIIQFATGATAISVAILILAVMIVDGFQSEIKNKIFGFWGHIQVVDYNSNKSSESLPFLIDTSVTNVLDNNKDIAFYQSFTTKAGIIKTNDHIEGVVLKGVDEDFNWPFLEKNLKAGEILDPQDTLRTRDIIISQSIAKRLNLNIGDPINIYFLKNRSLGKRLNVSGIYHTGLAEYDKIYCIVNSSLIQQVNKWEPNQHSGIEVFTNDINRIVTIDEQVYRKLPSHAKSFNIMEIYPNIFDWIHLTETNKSLILGLVIAVAAFNMMTVLLILILERTNMIGTLKALGMSNWSIQKVFLYHAAYIVFYGLVIGNAIGLGIAFSQHHWKWMKMDESAYYLEHVPISFDPSKVLIINIIAIFVINALLVIPSYFVQRITPIKAIRFD